MEKQASKSIGKILRTILLTLIFVEGIAFTITITSILNYEFYLSLIDIESLIAIFIMILTLIMFIIFLIWIYKVHVDMHRFNVYYPIKPSKSVWSFLIPVYNLYGAWNVFSNLANKFNSVNHSNSTNIGDKIMRILPVVYILIFSNQFINNLINRMTADGVVISEFMWLLVDIVFFTLLLTYWGLYKSITNGVQLMSTTNNTSNDDETTEIAGA